MKIRPKNIIYAAKGVLFSIGNEKGKNWRKKVFELYRQLLLEKLKKFGNRNDFGNWLNDMLSNHARIYKTSGGDSGLWEMETNYNPGVENYLKAYLNNNFKIDFNQYGIKPNQSTRYLIDGIRTSGDFQRDGFNYNADGLYSAITDDRRLLGRLEDWDEESLNQFNSELSQSGGWTMYLDNDGYYKLKRVGTSGANTSSNTGTTNNSNPTSNGLPFPENPIIKQLPVISLPMEDWLKNEKGLSLTVPTGRKEGGYKFDWNKLKTGFSNILNNPNIYSLGRLAGALISNEKIYDEALKGILPTLRQSYNTHRQVVGDEATKQAFYRRAAQGQTQAGRAITSDLDKQLAYQMEAKRIGDELRALGDLADNLEIRRTSDESNQHLWANIQRATEVANANIASINLANSLKHNLLALKYAANWSSIDNALQGIEYRKRQLLEEDLKLGDYIFSLQLEGVLYTPEYLRAYKKYYDTLEKHKKEDGGYDYTDPEVINARGEWNEFLKLLKILKARELLEYNRNKYVYFGKSGTKITRKKKDDLLYKSTRDVVEHFRKMSKMSSDALNRKKPKIEKLTSHPKGSTRKYLLGGLAPFVVYKPIALGGETTTSSGSSTSSTSKSEKDDLDLLKDLFKSLLTEGLPSDVNGIYKAMQALILRKEAFGEELSTSDIANMYIKQMLQVNNIKFSKAQYDKVNEMVLEKEAGSEYAIDLYGRIAIQDPDSGKVGYKKLENLKKEDIPLTNGDLLNLRATAYPFDNDMLQVAANATSMKEIAEFLKAQLPKIESSEVVIEGYTKKDSNNIKEGIKSLLLEAPEGDYKYSQTTKSNLELRILALDYLYKILPKKMKNLLEVNAGMLGTTSKALIGELVNAGEISISKTEFDAVTGKAAKDANGNSKDSDIKSNPLMQMLQGLGGIPRTYEIVTRDSNIKMSVDGTYYSLIPKITEDTSIDKMLSESGFAGILDSKLGITFGDLNISPELLKDIMYSNTGGVIVTLPCKIVDGHKEINLEVKNTYEKAILEVEELGISRNSSEFYKALGEKLKEKGLNSLLDANGYPDKNKFAPFLVVEAYTTSKISNLDKSSQYIEKVKNPSEELEKRMIEALSTDSKKSNYSLDIDYWFWGDDVYRGSVFIPLNNNLNAAINAWGDLIKVDESLELETRFQQFNKASAAKPTTSNILQ